MNINTHDVYGKHYRGNAGAPQHRWAWLSQIFSDVTEQIRFD